MPRRQPIPRLWLMTDERLGEHLWEAMKRLPRGGGVVFRHYGLSPGERRRLYMEVRRLARRRRLTLLVAGSALPGADGVHNHTGAGLRSASAHGLRELKAAERRGVDLVFLSPVFGTRSHPGARPLGPARFARIARAARVPVIALGGMNARRFRALSGAWGWGAIDAWTG